MKTFYYYHGKGLTETQLKKELDQFINTFGRPIIMPNRLGYTFMPTQKPTTAQRIRKIVKDYKEKPGYSHSQLEHDLEELANELEREGNNVSSKTNKKNL